MTPEQAREALEILKPFAGMFQRLSSLPGLMDLDVALLHHMGAGAMLLHNRFIAMEKGRLPIDDPVALALDAALQEQAKETLQ